MPLTDLSAELGPTEFALGSHTSIKRVCGSRLPEFPTLSFPVASGSIIMVDYPDHTAASPTLQTARPVVDAHLRAALVGGTQRTMAISRGASTRWRRLAATPPSPTKADAGGCCSRSADARRRPALQAEGRGRDDAAHGHASDEGAMQQIGGTHRHYYGLSDSWQAGLARELDDDYRRGLITCSLDPETKSLSCDRAPVERRPADLG